MRGTQQPHIAYNLLKSVMGTADCYKTILKYNEEDQLEMDKIFSILYMAMIAEEKKRAHKTWERIKDWVSICC